MKKLILLKSIPVLFVLMFLFGCGKKSTNTPDTPLPPNSDFSFIHNSDYDAMVEFSHAGSSFDTFSWNFGDGSTSTLQSPIHQFPSVGVTYTVKLTVTNSSNKSSTTTKAVTTEFAPGNLGIYHYAPGYFNDPNVYYDDVTVTGPFGTNKTGKISQSGFPVDCFDTGVLRFSLPGGTYTITATKMPSGKIFTGTATVTANSCKLVELIFP